MQVLSIGNGVGGGVYKKFSKIGEVSLGYARTQN